MAQEATRERTRRVRERLVDKAEDKVTMTLLQLLPVQQDPTAWHDPTFPYQAKDAQRSESTFVTAT